MLPPMQLQNSNCTQRSLPDVAVATIVDVAVAAPPSVVVVAAGAVSLSVTMTHFLFVIHLILKGGKHRCSLYVEYNRRINNQMHLTIADPVYY